MSNDEKNPLINMLDAKTALSIITCEYHPKRDNVKLCFFCLNLGNDKCPHLGKEVAGLCAGYVLDENPQTEGLVMAILRGD